MDEKLLNELNGKKKITADDLIRMKLKIGDKFKAKNHTELYIKSFDGKIEINEPTDDTLLDAEDLQKVHNDDLMGVRYLISQCVVSPNLKDERLLEEFECATSMELVDMLFDKHEQTRIIDEIMKLKDLSDDRVTALKNS